LNIAGRKSRFGNIPGAGENHNKVVETSLIDLAMPPPTARIVSNTIHNEPPTNNKMTPVEPTGKNSSE
jgi:hypothetical protein